MAIMPDRRDRIPEHPKGLLVERDCLVLNAKVIAHVLDDPATPAWLREIAEKVNDDLNWWLCYGPACDEPGRTLRLIPAGMKWPRGVCGSNGFYTDMVEEWLIDQDPDLIAAEPVRVALARQAAGYVDDDGYSIDFRMDCLDALNEVLASFRRVAADYKETEERIEQ